MLLSCQDKKQETNFGNLEAKIETEQNNIATVKKLLIEGDNKNTSYLDEICDPDYKYYFPSSNNPLSPEEHKQFWNAVNLSFPDLTHNVQEIFAVDDKVVARVNVSGTHQGDSAGLSPTGKFVEISQIFICHFRDGKLIALREEANMLGLYQQLGMELQLKQ